MSVEARSDDAALVEHFKSIDEAVNDDGGNAYARLPLIPLDKWDRLLALAEKGAAAAPGPDWKAEALAWRAWVDELDLTRKSFLRVETKRIRALNEREAAAPETP